MFITERKSSTKYSTSVKNMSHEALGQIASLNEPQVNEHSSDVVSTEQSYFSFKNIYNSLKKIMGKVNGGASMRSLMIYIFFADHFTSDFLKQCKKNSNVPQDISKDTKNIIKQFSLGDVLYSHNMNMGC